MTSLNTSLLARADHPVNAPLSEEAVRRVLDRAIRGRPARVLDLGCGQGVWLRHALAAHPGVRAVGVDVDGDVVDVARREGERAGVGERLTLRQVSTAEYESPEPFDVVLCVGSTHAFDGLVPALAAVRGHLAPGGVAVIGEGFWECEPGQAALDALGGERDEFADLATTVERIMAEGWAPVYGHTSSLAEWDEFEWSGTGALTCWALDHPEHPESGEAYRVAAAKRTGWLGGYRGTLGFVTLVLRAVEGAYGRGPV